MATTKEKFDRFLWNAPASAAFWCAGVALVVGFGGSTLSPIVPRVIAIVLGIGLGLFALLLFTKNKDHNPSSYAEHQPLHHRGRGWDKT